MVIKGDTRSLVIFLVRVPEKYSTRSVTIAVIDGIFPVILLLS